MAFLCGCERTITQNGEFHFEDDMKEKNEQLYKYIHRI